MIENSAALGTGTDIQVQRAAEVQHKSVQQPEPQGQPPSAQPDSADLNNLTLPSAQAVLSSGRNLVADYVMGNDNQLLQIRVIDPSTHQVIAASPPSTIARLQQEVLTYQGLGIRNQHGNGDSAAVEE